MPHSEGVQEQQEELARGNEQPRWEEDEQGVRAETETGEGAEVSHNEAEEAPGCGLGITTSSLLSSLGSSVA